MRRLPPHPHIMTVLRSFTDDASSLPGWDFERDIVQSRTMMLVMPFVPKDLKNALHAARRGGGGGCEEEQRFEQARAARICAQLARALAHLELHEVVHRDVKVRSRLREPRPRAAACARMRLGSFVACPPLPPALFSLAACLLTACAWFALRLLLHLEVLLAEP
eukprot:SAG11_NODE_1484_length_4826_cov_4.020309_2_plen_164_part_00